MVEENKERIVGSELGQVKWFDGQKGYGLLSDGGGRDGFVHFRAITSPGV